MKGSSRGRKGPTGERAPLIGRECSVFKLSEDTHVLNKPTITGRHKKPSSRDATPQTNHKRESSNWTQISGGYITNLSTGTGELGKEEHTRWKKRNRHLQTKILIGVCYVLVLVYTCVILVGPFLLSFQQESDWCPVHIGEDNRNLKSSPETVFNWDIPIQDREYNNPDFIQNPCRFARVPQLVWLTLEECDMSRRMLTSVILGSAIGYERRTSDRPAGIRTMGLVSLGACFFTISSIMAFRSSTMGWDASRVTAALPSGVGFLGAALIWKGSIADGDDEVHQVHGLTTAASLWLSAAIGVGAGGALYFVSIYSTVLILLVLRYGPSFYLRDDQESVAGEEEEKEQDFSVSERNIVKERWLEQAQEGSRATLQEGDSLPSEASEQQKSVRVSFVHAGFPESLTAEDYPGRSSVQTLDSSRSVADSIRTPEGRRRRLSHVYDPPTFHS